MIGKIGASEKHKKRKIKVKKQTVSHIFKHDIDKVFNFLKDFEEHLKPIEQFCGDFQTHRGGKTYEKNTLFSFISKHQIRMYVETEDIYETDSERILSLKVVKSEPFNLEFKIRFRCYRITENNYTLFLWDFIYYIPLEIKRDEINNNNCDRIKIIKLWEEYLMKKYGSFSKETQTIIINSTFKRVLHALLNCNIFLKLIPNQIIKYTLDGEFHKEGTNIFLSCKGNKEIHLKVDKSVYNRDLKEYEFSVEVMDNMTNMKKVCNKIAYKISKIQDKMTFMIFDHYIDFSIEKDYMEKILSYKKGVMMELKTSLEKN